MTSSKSDRFDILFEDFNFSGGLMALAAQKAGLKIAIKLNKKPETSYQPELSDFYPNTLTQVPKALKNYQFLYKCSSLFPQLNYPQRILNLENNSGSKTIAAIDKLLGRDRESASFPIKTSEYKEYAELSENFPKGVLLFEYLFDRNQAIVELLKLMKSEGAAILTDVKTPEANVTIKCLPFNRGKWFLDFDGKTLKYQNTLRASINNFGLHILRYYNGVSVQFPTYLQASNTDIQSNTDEIFTQLKIDFETNTSSIYKTSVENTTTYQSHLVLHDFALSEIRENTQNVQKQLSSKLRVRLDIESAVSSYHQESIDGEMFRLIQCECDEKYDLAKQTGIAYNWFVHIFYRHKNNIDELIDEAYEQMNIERDPVLIWTKVIEKFQTNQWKQIFTQE